MPRARRVQYEPAAARRQFEQGGWVPPVGGPGRPDRRLSTARGRFALPQDRSRAMTAGRVTVRAPAAYGHRLIDRPDPLHDGHGRHVRPTPFVERACHLMASRMTYAAGIRATPWPLGPSSWTGGMPMALGARSPRQSTGSPERPPHHPTATHPFAPLCGGSSRSRQARKSWTGTRWFIEVTDISDCFGSLDHEVMLEILKEPRWSIRAAHPLHASRGVLGGLAVERNAQRCSAGRGLSLLSCSTSTSTGWTGSLSRNYYPTTTEAGRDGITLNITGWMPECGGRGARRQGRSTRAASKATRAAELRPARSGLPPTAVRQVRRRLVTRVRWAEERSRRDQVSDQRVPSC